MHSLSLPKDTPFMEDSPVEEMQRFLKTFLTSKPTTKLGTAKSVDACTLIGIHYLHLIRSAGMLNATGFHTASLTLFRPIEDTLDVFMACGTIENSCEKWQMNNLNPSEAAKAWIKEFKDKFLVTIRPELAYSDYRKNLRDKFSKYSHCTSLLTQWNIFKADNVNYSINTIPSVIIKNAMAIDANLAFSIWEFAYLLNFVYEKYLNQNENFNKIYLKLSNVIQEMDKDNIFNNLLFPPGLSDLKDKLPKIKGN